MSFLTRAGNRRTLVSTFDPAAWRNIGSIRFAAHAKEKPPETGGFFFGVRCTIRTRRTAALHWNLPHFSFKANHRIARFERTFKIVLNARS
jgi:hypothetical protein